MVSDGFGESLVWISTEISRFVNFVIGHYGSPVYFESVSVIYPGTELNRIKPMVAQNYLG